MIEMMIDLETLDVKPSAVVLSIGAVTFETFTDCGGHLDYFIWERFYRVLDMSDQMKNGRTVSQSTLLWWMRQNADARDEAFATVRQQPWRIMNDLQEFVTSHTSINGVPINKFWASPVGFDYGIWNNLADDHKHDTPWTYRQVYDVRTVLNEASYSAKDHVMSHAISGKPHMPVYDCEVQIAELIAARNKIGRRIANSS